MSLKVTSFLRGRKIVFTGIGVAIVIIVAMFLFSASSFFAKNYAIDVDPIKDSQNLFSTARVTVSNIGKLPLTNIVVNYGGTGNHAIEKIASLSPGDKVLLSPPEDSPLKSVTVTTGQGLSITKGYRTPFKIPGMMGS
jgi:hypothetical protein